MNLKAEQQVAFWLVLSAALLTTLIPGGPVENRDFSHIHPGILGSFNVFLTTLDLGSLPLAYFAAKGKRWALNGAFLAAMAYFGVYAVDLAQLFPQSPTPMSKALSVVEVLGMAVAVPLMFASRRALDRTPRVDNSLTYPAFPKAIAFSLLLSGLGIVWFATDAAMSGGTNGASTIEEVTE